MTLAFAILAPCALALAAWWFLRTMRHVDQEIEWTRRMIGDYCARFNATLAVTLHDSLLDQEEAFNLRLDRLYERLVYDTEKTGLEEPPTIED